MTTDAAVAAIVRKAVAELNEALDKAADAGLEVKSINLDHVYQETRKHADVKRTLDVGEDLRCLGSRNGHPCRHSLHLKVPGQSRAVLRVLTHVLLIRPGELLYRCDRCKAELAVSVRPLRGAKGCTDLV